MDVRQKRRGIGSERGRVGYEVFQGGGSGRVGGVGRIESNGDFRCVRVDDGKEGEKIGAQGGEGELLGGRVCLEGCDGESAGLGKQSEGSGCLSGGHDRTSARGLAPRVLRVPVIPQFVFAR